ncbi:MAG: FliH/SctL family protein [Defluviitaleaceae bacterium]|nr:FliH/SctL family protein [Defluviitaleaceae bacterium]
MTLSSSRILKAQTVYIDTENKFVIETDAGEAETHSDEPFDPEKKERDAHKSAKGIIKDAEQQAEEIINAARHEAMEVQAEIRKNADSEAAQVISEAREQGYSEGMATAVQEGDAIRAEAQQVLDDAIAERKAMQESLEPEIVEMVISITEKLLGNIKEINPAAIVNLIKQGFAESVISGEIKINVSADDYEYVVKNKEELLSHTDGSVNLLIVKDLSLSPMDCIIETPFGDIDCSLGQQYESLRANLMLILNNTA